MSSMWTRPFSPRTTRFIFIGTIIFLIIMIILLYNSYVDLKKISYKEGFNFVKPIEYDESKWYYQMPSALWNEERSDYIFPSDKLRYIVTLYQKVPYPIEIKSDMQIFIGGNNVTTVQPELHVLNLNSTHQFDGIIYTFLPHDGGTNEVHVNLEITNGSNKVSLENRTEILKFDVLSEATKLQVDANNNTQLGIILSTVTAIASVGFLGYQTMKLREEKNQTIRAWLGQKGGASLEPSRIYNEKGEIKTIEEWGKMSQTEMQNFNASTYEHLIRIKNFGQIPAFNVRARFVCSVNSDRKELDKEEWWDPGEIMPQDDAKYTLPIPKGYYEKVQTNHTFKFYLIFELKYTSGNSQIEKIYGFMSEFAQGGITKISHWDEKKHYGKDEKIS